MEFEDIRHFRNDEVPSVLERLNADSGFWDAVSFFFNESEIAEIQASFLEIDTKSEFQSRLIHTLLTRIIKSSISELSTSGLDQLRSDTPYLFISNHRDIVLDSALINVMFFEAFGKTLEIAIGSNLLKLPWVADVVRLNKSFIVHRDLPMNEMLEAAQTLSSYIEHRIDSGATLWMAQREGRAIDGYDRTHSGLVKMLGLATGNGVLNHLKKLNIVPVSISYEEDPCALLKLPTLSAKSKGLNYVKSELEDLNSMKQGILGQKGRVHISYGQPISGLLDSVDNTLKINDQLKCVTQIIDKQIHSGYKIWPSNQEAADILTGKLSQQEAKSTALVAHLSNLNEDEKELFLKMYANPVFNKQEGEA